MSGSVGSSAEEPRAEGSGRADVVTALAAVALLAGSILIVVLLGWLGDEATASLGLLVAVQLVAGAYLFAGLTRYVVQFGMIGAWVAALALLTDTSMWVWLFHLLGGVATAALLEINAQRQAATRECKERSGREAEALTRLLVSVLQVNSLEPRAVLTAVVNGLREIGLAVVEVRRVDEVAKVARLELGSTSVDRPLSDELPIDFGLIETVLRTDQTEIIDHVGGDPRALAPELDIQGGIAMPLPLGDGGRGVLIAASMTGPLTDLQRGAVEMLAAHAAGALERASTFEADARIVEDLRRLDERTQDFVSTASHELRTPLTVISGLGQTLRRHWEELPDERRGDLLQRIDANAERLAVMVGSLLDTSALERGELRPVLAQVPLRDTVVRLLDRLATVTAAYPISVEVPDDLQVMVDPALFEHVVENLITNVAKHTPQGTWVILEAERLEQHVQVAVRDLGPGIAPDDLPHVLDRFYRGGEPTRRTSGGLGLGLALAQQIIRAHGSELEVASAAGEGTTFRFRVAAG